MNKERPHLNEHEFLQIVLVQLKVAVTEILDAAPFNRLYRLVEDRLIELHGTEKETPSMHAIYYYKPGSNDRGLYLVEGCGQYTHEHEAIEAAKGFARHPEGCLGYYPAAPVVFVVVKLIGRAEFADVVWTPYDYAHGQQPYPPRG